MDNEEKQAFKDVYVKQHKGQDFCVEDFNMRLKKFMEKGNHFSIPLYENYSPEEMNIIIYGPWSKISPIRIKIISDAVFDEVPLFRQIKYVINLLLENGKIKLTTKGNFPIKIVKDLYHLGAKEYYIENGIIPLANEDRCLSVKIVHDLLKLSRVVKERKKVMTLTKNGEKLIASNQKLFEFIIKILTTSFDLGCFDGYGSQNIGLTGFGYSLILVSKFGTEKCSSAFYSEKYFKAFSYLLQEITKGYSTLEKIASNCYVLRVFDICMKYLGIIDYEEGNRFNDDSFVKKTPLFDKLFEVTPPGNVDLKAVALKENVSKNVQKTETFQFKLQIEDVTEPSVWRRIVVPANITFDKFHEIIQKSFGWKDYHLYEFLDEEYHTTIRFSVPSEYDCEYPFTTQDSSIIKLSDFFSDKNRVFKYIYDLGDCWTHDITLESISEEDNFKAVCLDGKGTCPPEDCGAGSGYEEMKNILKTSPYSDEAEEYRVWLGLKKGEKWNSDNIDLDSINAFLKNVL